MSLSNNFIKSNILNLTYLQFLFNLTKCESYSILSLLNFLMKIYSIYTNRLFKYDYYQFKHAIINSSRMGKNLHRSGKCLVQFGKNVLVSVFVLKSGS